MHRLILVLLLAGLFPAAASAGDALNKTSVRVQGEPQGTFRHSTSTVLTRVQVSARNVGTVAAEGVQVFVDVPGGSRVTLSGPEKLEPNKSGVYTAEPNQKITSTQKLKAEAHCGNCW